MNAVHETLHAIGSNHEQSRPVWNKNAFPHLFSIFSQYKDRDGFIQIVPENMIDVCVIQKHIVAM